MVYSRIDVCGWLLDLPGLRLFTSREPTSAALLEKLHADVSRQIHAALPKIRCGVRFVGCDRSQDAQTNFMVSFDLKIYSHGFGVAFSGAETVRYSDSESWCERDCLTVAL
jgi:hypothetical protein